jgi:hypothetical protein
MKALSVITIAASLVLIVLTSPPYSQPDQVNLVNNDGPSWVNPDGAHGLIVGALVGSSRERREHVWVNPDGVRGTDNRLVGLSPARDYSWVNPDGSTGHLSPAHANASRSEIAF